MLAFFEFLNMALRLRELPVWKESFVAAGIHERGSIEYAQLFVANRLTEQIMCTLKAEYMHSIDIKVI